MNIIELIGRLEEFDDNLLVKIHLPNDTIVSSDFSCDSWRGSYNQPATIIHQDEDFHTVKSIIENLREVNGMQVTGWKGGDFVLSDSSLVYLVTDWGNSGACTAVAEIIDEVDYILMVAADNQY